MVGSDQYLRVVGTRRIETWRGQLLAVAMVGCALAGGWITLLAVAAASHGPTAVGAFVVDYDGRLLDDGLELLIVQSDGQAFATLARDPLVQRPKSFRTAGEASYRAQRPLLGWLAAFMSLGRSGWVPPAMALIAAASTGAAAAGAGRLLLQRGRSPWLGLVVFVLPGTASSLGYLGPEPLVLALLVWGVVAWEGDRVASAVGLFVLAALGRETALLVPFGLAATSLLKGRWRATIATLTVPAALVAWYAALRWRLGAWPWDAGEGRLAPPVQGLVRAAREIWTDPWVHVPHLALLLVIVIGATTIARRDELTGIVVAHATFALVLGRYVWAEPGFYSRVLLPMHVLGTVAIAGGFGRKSKNGTSDVGSTDSATSRSLVGRGGPSAPVVDQRSHAFAGVPEAFRLRARHHNGFDFPIAEP